MSWKKGILILLFTITACGDAGVKKKVEDLDHSIDAYAYALRWGRTNDVVAYHVYRDASKPEIDMSVMDVIRVTGYTIKEKKLNDDITEADVVGQLDYYHNEYGTLKKLEYRQSWWFEPETKKWYLESEFPEFR